MRYILSIILILIVPCFAFSQGQYKVLEIIDGDTIYIDFNNDGRIQKDEKVRINGIDTFETKSSNQLECQANQYKLTKDEVLDLGRLGKEYARKILLNNYVEAEYTAETKRCYYGRHLMSVSVNNKDYATEVLKEGLAVVYRKSNIASELQQYENLGKMNKQLKKIHKGT